MEWIIIGNYLETPHMKLKEAKAKVKAEAKVRREGLTCELLLSRNDTAGGIDTVHVQSVQCKSYYNSNHLGDAVDHARLMVHQPAELIIA